jgi:hypothetical protein
LLKTRTDVVPIPAINGACNIFNGLAIVFKTWRGVYLNVFIYTLGLLNLCCGVWFIYMAYVGRLPIKDENQTVGEHNHDNALGGVVMVEEAVERVA